MRITSQLTSEQFKEMIIDNIINDPSTPKNIKKSLGKENLIITAKVKEDDTLESLNIVIEVDT